MQGVQSLVHIDLMTWHQTFRTTELPSSKAHSKPCTAKFAYYHWQNVACGDPARSQISLLAQQEQKQKQYAASLPHPASLLVSHTESVFIAGCWGKHLSYMSVACAHSWPWSILPSSSVSETGSSAACSTAAASGTAALTLPTSAVTWICGWSSSMALSFCSSSSAFSAVMASSCDP